MTFTAISNEKALNFDVSAARIMHPNTVTVICSWCRLDGTNGWNNANRKLSAEIVNGMRASGKIVNDGICPCCKKAMLSRMAGL